MTLSDDYAGTGLSFADLNALPRRERNALLARTIDALNKQIKPFSERKKEAERFLEQDMFANGAAVIDAGDFTVKREETGHYEYDAEGLSMIQAFDVTLEEYEQCVKSTVKVDKRMLNEIAKRGAKLKAIIDQSCRWTVTSSKVIVTRKKTVVEKDSPRVFGEMEAGVRPGER